MIMELLAGLTGHVTTVHSMRSEQSENSFKLYHYHPTEVGAIIFVLLFLATTLGHAWQLLRYRVWFVTPIIVGGVRTCLSLPAVLRLD
jgi:hypothetical protein